MPCSHQPRLNYLKIVNDLVDGMSGQNQLIYVAFTAIFIIMLPQCNAIRVCTRLVSTDALMSTCVLVSLVAFVSIDTLGSKDAPMSIRAPASIDAIVSKGAFCP